MTSILGLIVSIGETANPIFLYYILQFLENPDDNNFTKGYLLAGGLMLTQFVTFMAQEHTQVYNVIYP